MAYNIEEVGALDSCCRGCEIASLGSKLDTLIEDLSNDTAYSGELLSDAEKSYLNNLCVGTATLGDVLDDALTSSQTYTTVTLTVSNALKASFEGVCETFRISQIGSRLQSAITKINSMVEWDEAEIKSYYLTGFSDYPAAIDDETYAMSIDLPYGSVVTAAIGNFELSDGASAYISDVLQETGVTQNNLTSAKTYNVVSKNEEVDQDFVLTVTILENTEAQLLTFAIGAITATIDEEAKTVTAELPFGSDLSSQIATFTMSANASAHVGATTITSAVTVVNYSAAVDFEITSEDEVTTNTYVVTLTVAAE